MEGGAAALALLLCKKKKKHTHHHTIALLPVCGRQAAGMKAVNSDLYHVVLKGEVWGHTIAPCAKGAVCLLANNESVVTWLSPKDSHADCTSHIPVILFKNKYWTLSLRMSKCIYRHIRLRKGFHNIQNVHGVETLRIPQLLLNEKKRTQARFEVSPEPAAQRVACVQRLRTLHSEWL